jgi:hypothetical protein
MKIFVFALLVMITQSLVANEWDRDPNSKSCNRRREPEKKSEKTEVEKTKDNKDEDKKVDHELVGKLVKRLQSDYDKKDYELMREDAAILLKKLGNGARSTYMVGLTTGEENNLLLGKAGRIYSEDLYTVPLNPLTANPKGQFIMAKFNDVDEAFVYFKNQDYARVPKFPYLVLSDPAGKKLVYRPSIMQRHDASACDNALRFMDALDVESWKGGYVAIPQWAWCPVALTKKAPLLIGKMQIREEVIRGRDVSVSHLSDAAFVPLYASEKILRSTTTPEETYLFYNGQDFPFRGEGKTPQ